MPVALKSIKKCSPRRLVHLAVLCKGMAAHNSGYQCNKQSALPLPDKACAGRHGTSILGIVLARKSGVEFGLIQAWRESGHGTLIGYLHSMLRFWDLRYYRNSQNFKFQSVDGDQILRPDHFAVNNKHDYVELQQRGYPMDELVKVEALRYEHLRGSKKINTQVKGFHLN